MYRGFTTSSSNNLGMSAAAKSMNFKILQTIVKECLERFYIAKGFSKLNYCDLATSSNSLREKEKYLSQISNLF